MHRDRGVLPSAGQARLGHHCGRPARAVRDYGFDELNLPRLISLIHPDNVASQRVAE